jgi:hypothetical protein
MNEAEDSICVDFCLQEIIRDADLAIASNKKASRID